MKSTERSVKVLKIRTKIFNRQFYRVKVIKRLKNGARKESYKDFPTLEQAELYSAKHHKYRKERGYKHISETSYIYKV